MSAAMAIAVSESLPTLTKRGLERRAALLRAADDLFLRHGYDGVSLDDFVAHAGGSKAAVYQHFGSKKGLLVAWVKVRSRLFFTDPAFADPDAVQCEKPQRMFAQQGIRDVLLHITSTMFYAFSHPDNIAFMRLIVHEAQHDPEIGKISYELGALRGLNIMSEILIEADAAGEIYCKTPFESAVMFSGIFRYTYHRVLIGLPALDAGVNADVFYRNLVDIFLAAHQPRQS